MYGEESNLWIIIVWLLDISLTPQVHVFSPFPPAWFGRSVFRSEVGCTLVRGCPCWDVTLIHSPFVIQLLFVTWKIPQFVHLSAIRTSIHFWNSIYSLFPVSKIDAYTMSFLHCYSVDFNFVGQSRNKEIMPQFKMLFLALLQSRPIIATVCAFCFQKDAIRSNK
jgi:hypothetical protein